MSKMNFSLATCCAALATVMLVGCAPMSMSFLAKKPKGLEQLRQHIGSEVGSLEFTFDLDDRANGSDEEVGSGYIVVLREGKEVQALPHAFEMRPDQLATNAWLEFNDFNGDGFTDFKASRLDGSGGQLPLDSLYQFDPKSGTFALIDALSSVGELTGSAPGCVSLKLLTAAKTTKVEHLCFVASTAQWVMNRGGVGRRHAVARSALNECDPLAPSLKSCRSARIEMDRKLLTLLADHRVDKRKSLRSLQGKGYADSYAKSVDWDHLSWKRYRDSRCSVEVRERAVSPNKMPAAVELCRYDWSRDQVRRYSEHSARFANASAQQ